MKYIQSLTRRDFLTSLALAAPAISLMDTPTVMGAASASQRFPILAFSKASQDLGFEETADLVAEVGYDGIECPVRKGGQVLPERVEEDLPKLVEALKKRNCGHLIMATDIHNVTDPLTERVLRTASRLGIKRYRLGQERYREGRSVPDQLKEMTAELRDLVALNKELGVCAGFQNHSGGDLIGAPVWDIYEVIKDLDPEHIGVFFDIAHATIEGGYAWTIHAQLMEPYFRSVYVKDFTWKKTNNRWTAAWCPLGEGMVNRAFFERLKRSNFRGPISQHHEYPISTGKARVEVLKKDLRTLQSWLA
jgi:sugar phosphate isomerase/epimerase